MGAPGSPRGPGPGCTQSSSAVRGWGEAGERRRGRRPDRWGGIRGQGGGGERAREETREDHREERGEEVELAGRGGCAGFAFEWEMAFTRSTSGLRFFGFAGRIFCFVMTLFCIPLAWARCLPEDFLAPGLTLTLSLPERTGSGTGFLDVAGFKGFDGCTWLSVFP